MLRRSISLPPLLANAVRGRIRSALTGLLPFFLLFASPAVAQHRFDQWTTDNGLPQNSVVKSAFPTLYIQYLNFASRPGETLYQLFNRGWWERLPKAFGAIARLSPPFAVNPPVLIPVLLIPVLIPVLIEDTRGRLLVQFSQRRWALRVAWSAVGNHGASLIQGSQGQSILPRSTGPLLEMDISLEEGRG